MGSRVGSRAVATAGADVTPEKIYTFGCSYTYGAHILHQRDQSGPTMQLEDNPSWPEQLSLLLPDTEIIDYSFIGTSLEYSIYQFNQIKSQLTDRDRTIVCATTPYRYSHWADGSLDDPELRMQISPNYEKYSPDIRHNLIRYHPGWDRAEGDTPGYKNKNLDKGVYWHRFSQHNTELEAATHSSLLEYIKDTADLAFTHVKYQYHTEHTENIPCIENMLTEEQFKSFVHDDGKHFNLSGAEWVAEWVRNQILN